jgi:hypothetical protein
MMEAISSYETSVLTRVTLHHIPEDDVHDSHCRENLKSYEGSVKFTEYFPFAAPKFSLAIYAICR